MMRLISISGPISSSRRMTALVYGILFPGLVLACVAGAWLLKEWLAAGGWLR